MSPQRQTRHCIVHHPASSTTSAPQSVCIPLESNMFVYTMRSTYEAARSAHPPLEVHLQGVRSPDNQGRAKAHRERKKHEVASEGCKVISISLAISKVLCVLTEWPVVYTTPTVIDFQSSRTSWECERGLPSRTSRSLIDSLSPLSSHIP